MGLEELSGIIGVAGTVAGTVGFVFMKNKLEEKKDDKVELREIRDKLRKLAKVDEVAEIELEQSCSRKVKTKSEIVKEKDYLSKILNEIVESRRKQSLDVLEVTRSELCELAKKNEKAKKELKESYVRRITTEKTALKEIDRLTIIINALKDEQRKIAFDELNKVRDRLYVLSLEHERASSELEDSYNKKILNEEQAKRESKRLSLVVKDVEEHARKTAFDRLTIVRDELYKISLEDENAKLHLQESYNRRVTTERAINEEIDKLTAIVDDITEERRKAALQELLQARGDLYCKARENEVIRRALNDSYNKRITEDKIAYKEIERLLEVEENEEYKLRTV